MIDKKIFRCTKNDKAGAQGDKAEAQEGALRPRLPQRKPLCQQAYSAVWFHAYSEINASGISVTASSRYSMAESCA